MDALARVAPFDLADASALAEHDEYGSVVADLDMGWKDIKVAVEYDGEQHRKDHRQYTWDIRRLEILERRGWIVVR